MRGNLIVGVCLLVLGVLTAVAEEPSDQFYQAIRNNDLSALASLVKTVDVNTKDQHESTPLMYAAAYGSLDAMRLLLGAGANVNAKNAFDTTALLWCAGDLAKVRLLVEKGANINARSKQGRTPLIIAAAQDGNSETVKLLLEKGADVSARTQSENSALHVAAEANDTESVRLLLSRGVEINAKNRFGDTALMYAAALGNIESMKLLLAKGADVNVVDLPDGGRVKNGPIALGNFTALHLAAITGGAEAVKLVLQAGAQVNLQDVRGMTALMLAIGTDRPDVGVIRLLLEKGADKNIKSKAGETAADWAMKFNYPPVLDAFGIEHKDVAIAAVLVPAGESKLPGPKEAAAKSIALLQHSSGDFFKEGGCVSCHAQNLTGLAVSVARAHGIKVDEAAAAAQLKAVKLQWGAFEQVLLQRMDPPGAVDTTSYSLLQLAAEGAPADHAIDALIHNLAGQQRKNGNWHLDGKARPPIEDGDFSRTALSIRALSTYGLPGRKAEFEQRVQRGAAWIEAAPPYNTEDRNMQLLGLKWAGRDRRALEGPLKKLIALQRADGGWGQTADLASDAYATGSVLYTIHELGVASNDPAYRRGVTYLLRTQLEDGSWHVASRAPKFQPYFQSGFPHDHDQWISAAATAWGAMALSYAVPDRQVALK
ncbi:MAG TPA: ankyrin repeat domain-containing protein [Bryobacteraceae bacterium]|jgi:ankyrin repeat protein|nr:ankyrin repeat domain-containing protein [Bryobacteraceae bacterium]